jgi:hypothetical protein
MCEQRAMSNEQGLQDPTPIPPPPPPPPHSEPDDGSGVAAAKLSENGSLPRGIAVGEGELSQC